MVMYLSHFHSNVVAACHKHKRGTDIVLVPQPSDDVNDPLNWPNWKRSLSFSTICAFTFMVSWTLGGLSAALVLLSEDLKSDLDATVHGAVSWVSLTIGLAVNSSLYFQLTCIELLLDSHSSGDWDTALFRAGFLGVFRDNHLERRCHKSRQFHRGSRRRRLFWKHDRSLCSCDYR